jgi:superfamily II DNA helicase RecQ
MNDNPLDQNVEAIPSKKHLQKSVWIYKHEELNLKTLAACTKFVLKQLVFPWQLEVGTAVLCEKDIIVDVGTGGGKSVGFSTPLVLHETDIALRVTPLIALMIDQVCVTHLAH